MERKKNPSAFIRNTHTILQRFDLNHIIAWNQEGNGFIIHDLPKFQSQILPQYFKHQKYTSFVRQLNMYGFHKQRHPLTQNYFQHQSFRRGQNLTEIKRKPQKKKKSQEQGGIVSINKYSQINQQFNRQSQISQNIPSQGGINHQGNSQIWEKQKYLSKAQIDQQQIQIPTCNVSSLCEKAVYQNQILTKMHEVLLKQMLRIKKFRYEWLQQTKKTNKQLYNDSLSYLCQAIKSQTLKLSAHLDCQTI